MLFGTSWLWRGLEFRMRFSWGLVGGVRGRKTGDAKYMLFWQHVHYFKGIHQRVPQSDCNAFWCETGMTQVGGSGWGCCGGWLGLWREGALLGGWHNPICKCTKVEDFSGSVTLDSLCYINILTYLLGHEQMCTLTRSKRLTEYWEVFSLYLNTISEQPSTM